MTSKLVSASVIAIAALAPFASTSSFAEGHSLYLPNQSAQASVPSTLTRAEVRAELSAFGPHATTGVIEHSYPVAQ